LTAKHKTFIPLLLFIIGLGACRPEPDLSVLSDDFTPFRIVFVGDILLADAAQPFLDEHGYQWPFEHVSNLLTGDYLIGNGEGPITTLEQPWDPNQRWSYNAQPQAAQALAEIGFDALGYANNHAMDRGPEGLADTIAHLAANDLAFFGAGLDQAHAETPLLIETPYGIVGVVALGEDWGHDRTAAEDQASTIPLSKASIRRGYDLAREGGTDWVVAYVHWGLNYAEVSGSQRRWADEFARTGYDLVIGHGAHSLQGIEIIQGMPVFYSLGNFVFGTPGRFSEEYPGFGLVVSAELGPQGFTQVAIYCIQTDNQVIDFQPQPCPPAQAQDVFEGLYDGLTIEENTALLTW
jgi:poly-gamma-glutamate synthesis protein (capsule biosynthesis protein)